MGKKTPKVIEYFYRCYCFCSFIFTIDIFPYSQYFNKCNGGLGWCYPHTYNSPKHQKKKENATYFSCKTPDQGFKLSKKNFYRHNVYNSVKIQTPSDLYIVKKGSCLNSVSKNISFTIALFYAKHTSGSENSSALLRAGLFHPTMPRIRHSLSKLDIPSTEEIET